jgi:5,6-dimethylbenzimidazole synthase
MRVASAERRDDVVVFDDAFRDQLRDLLVWRRDVRHFRREPLPDGTLERLLALACLAPSVGLSQPWRFVVVEDAARRAAVRAHFQHCNGEALKAYEGGRARLYAELKLAGLGEAPLHLAVFAERDPSQGHGLGRRTLSEMAAYSAVTAVHTIWLAARAEGLGLGWVSILDPAEIARILDVPLQWAFIGYLCLGYPERDNAMPELERRGWEQRRPWQSFVLRR